MWRFFTYYVAENPWYLAGAFGLVGAGFLIAMRITQDGRYLTRALIALGLAAAVLVVEALWVTEAERIERVVRELVDAVSRSDADRVLALFDDPVTFSIRSNVAEELDTATIRRGLSEVAFDWLYLSRLNARAGEQTRRGSAEFRLNASGTYHMMVGSRNFAGNSEWSLGFRRLPTGEWKINRVTAVSLPPYASLDPLNRRTQARPARPGPPPTPPADPAEGAGGPTLPRPGRGRLRPVR